MTRLRRTNAAELFRSRHGTKTRAALIISGTSLGGRCRTGVVRTRIAAFLWVMAALLFLACAPAVPRPLGSRMPAPPNPAVAQPPIGQRPAAARPFPSLPGSAKSDPSALVQWEYAYD